MKIRSFFNGLVRNVIIVSFVSLFTDLSSQMVFPVVPLFLLSLGASAWVIGLVEGAAETTASLLKVFSGYWSDRIRRRKPFVLGGYGLSTITKPMFALAYTWPFVLFVRVLERVGKGVRDAPRDAISLRDNTGESLWVPTGVRWHRLVFRCAPRGDSITTRVPESVPPRLSPRDHRGVVDSFHQGETFPGGGRVSRGDAVESEFTSTPP
jgi:hypothetical protein